MTEGYRLNLMHIVTIMIILPIMIGVTTETVTIINRFTEPERRECNAQGDYDQQLLK